MEPALSASQLAILFAALLAAGVVTGFMAGLLGVGGGGILVPVLYETFTALGVDPAIRMHMALGTSLAVIAPTSLKSFSAHRAKGAADMAVLKRLGPFVFAGAVAGILTAKASNSDVLKSMWVVFGTIMAIKMALGREDWRLGSGLPLSWLVDLYAMAVGFVSILMSIGGAVFIVTLMTLYGRPLLQAVATSSGFGPIIAIPGVLGFIWAGWGTPGTPLGSLGFVSLLGAAVILPASLFAAPFGVRMAHGIPKRRLEIIFAIFLAAVAVRFLISLLA